MHFEKIEFPFPIEQKDETTGEITHTEEIVIGYVSNTYLLMPDRSNIKKSVFIFVNNPEQAFNTNHTLEELLEKFSNL